MDDDKCESCRYWRHDGRSKYETGDCHRYPPGPIAADEYRSAFPRTNADGFCGEYKAKDA